MRAPQLIVVADMTPLDLRTTDTQCTEVVTIEGHRPSPKPKHEPPPSALLWAELHSAEVVPRPRERSMNEKAQNASGKEMALQPVHCGGGSSREWLDTEQLLFFFGSDQDELA